MDALFAGYHDHRSGRAAAPIAARRTFSIVATGRGGGGGGGGEGRGSAGVGGSLGSAIAGAIAEAQEERAGDWGAVSERDSLRPSQAPKAVATVYM